MKIGVTGQFETEPSRLIFVECCDAPVFFNNRPHRAAWAVQAERDRIAPEDAAGPRQQPEHHRAPIKGRETEETLLCDLRPVFQLRCKSRRPPFHLWGDWQRLFAARRLTLHREALVPDIRQQALDLGLEISS